MNSPAILKWTKIFISVISFGMIFPHALTEGMERTEVPPYLGDAEEEKQH